jgi:hypothetical protein
MVCNYSSVFLFMNFYALKLFIWGNDFHLYNNKFKLKFEFNKKATIEAYNIAHAIKSLKRQGFVDLFYFEYFFEITINL